VGLEGFGDKYPHELSGGMQQRVALCRALVHDPDILLLDEPFGALDALTRDQMNYDLQRLWLEKRKTAILVTHSIDEAVWMSDRVLVITPRPARIAEDITIDLPRPRSIAVKTTPQFNAYTGHIRELFSKLGVFRTADNDGK
jgi:NitT/TauT family transport system ATP-binding protein